MFTNSNQWSAKPEQTEEFPPVSLGFLSDDPWSQKPNTNAFVGNSRPIMTHGQPGYLEEMVRELNQTVSVQQQEIQTLKALIKNQEGDKNIINLLAQTVSSLQTQLSSLQSQLFS